MRLLPLLALLSSCSVPMGSRTERAELDRERAVVPNITIEVRGGSITNYGAGVPGTPLPMEVRESGWERVERPLPTPEPVQPVPTRPAHRHAQTYPSYVPSEVPEYETLEIPRRYPPYAK